MFLAGRQIVVGVTSSMGCGSSTIAKMFKALGAQVIEADKVARKTLASNKAVQKKLAKAFGMEILSGKKVSRKKLAAVAFQNPGNLKKLDQIMHPPILKEIKAQLKAFKKKDFALVVLDAPLLLETKLDRLVRKVVLVKASRETQLNRLTQKGFSKEEALKRIKMQMPLRLKMKKADYLVDNNSSLKEARRQVKLIVEDLKGEMHEP